MQRQDSESSFSADSLREALLWLSDAGLMSCDSAQLDLALSEALHHPGMSRQPLESLRYVAGVTGGCLNALSLTLKELLMHAKLQKPMILLCKPVSGQNILMALTAYRAFHYQVVIFSEQGTLTRWLPWHQLKHYLGLQLAEERLDCLMPQAQVFWGEKETVARHLSPKEHLIRLMRLERRDLFVVVIYSLLTGLLSLVVPVAIQALVNNVAFGALLQPIVILTLLVFGALSFLALLRTLRLNLVEIIQRRIFVRVAADLSERLLQVKLPFFDSRHGPELVNRFFDVLTVQKSTALLLVDGLAIILQTLTGMLLLAFYHPFLLGFDLMLMVFICVILFVLGWKAEPTAIKESKMKYDVAAWLEEMSSHLTPFRSHSGHQFARRRTDQLLRHYLKARQLHFRVVQRQHIGAYLLQAFASASLLGLGGWLVIERQLSIGQLVAAELVVATLLDGFAKFGKQLESYYDLLAALDKLGHLFEMPVEQVSPGLLVPKAQGIQVSLSEITLNSPAGGTLLSGLSLELKAGERVGILGANSWAAKALADALYASKIPDQGRIEMDGRDLRQLLPIDLRSQVALVRGLDILSGSIEDNLRLGQIDLSAQDLQTALRAVGLFERVQQLKEGLATPLSLSGFPLAPEELHRLMVARALLLRPRLLILDGVLDQLDWREKGPLAKYLFEETSMTVLVLTNKQEFLSFCDQAYALNAQGKLESLRFQQEISPQGGN